MIYLNVLTLTGLGSYTHAGLTPNRVSVFVTGSTTLKIVWWPGDSLFVVMYSVLCHINSPTDNKEVAMERNIIRFTENAINTVTFFRLMPTTRYTCCVVEYTVDNSIFESCNNVTTQSRCAAYGQNSVNANYNATITIVIIFFVLLLVTAVCIVIMLTVLKKQRRNAKKIVMW